MDAVIAGFAVSLSLIVAIGAQNAFVLKQGLRKHHVFLVSTICATSDAILIFAGVTGFGAVVDRFPSVQVVATLGGAAFLIAYGTRSFFSAFRYQHSLDPAGDAGGSVWSTALICLALTWLNPHVYLDTLVLIGSVSTRYADGFMFGLGACTASFVFFYSLGYGARLLTPVFQQPVSWKVLEFLVGILMYGIAASLLIDSQL